MAKPEKWLSDHQRLAAIACCKWINNPKQRCLPRVWSPAFIAAFMAGAAVGRRIAMTERKPAKKKRRK